MKKRLLLVVAAFVFIFTCYLFVTDALRYDPLADVFVKKSSLKPLDLAAGKFAAAWGPEIHDKNLFSQNRSFFEPKPVVVDTTPPVEPPKRPELALKGIVLDTFGEYVAYIEINQARSTPLRKGDKIEDIEVSDISAKQVVLKWNNETIPLTIEKVKTLMNRQRTGR